MGELRGGKGRGVIINGDVGNDARYDISSEEVAVAAGGLEIQG